MPDPAFDESFSELGTIKVRRIQNGTDTFKLPSGREVPMDRLPQRNDALIEQLYDLWAVGMRLGMHDAANWLKLRIPRSVQDILTEVCAQRGSKTS